MGMGLLAIVLSIYIARDIPRVGSSVSNFAHQSGYRDDAERLMADISRIWNAYLRGQIILAIVIGVAVSLILGILGVSNSLALGILSGLMEFLPVLGPFIATAVAVIVAVFQDGNMWGFSPLVLGLIVLGVMVAVQLVEGNVLVPRIVGDALDLHPLLVMISVLMGASLAGILGAILAAPVVASIKLLGAYGWRKMLDLPPFGDDAGDGETNQDESGIQPVDHHQEGSDL